MTMGGVPGLFQRIGHLRSCHAMGKPRTQTAQLFNIRTPAFVAGLECHVARQKLVPTPETYTVIASWAL